MDDGDPNGGQEKCQLISSLLPNYKKIDYPNRHTLLLLGHDFKYVHVKSQAVQGNKN